MKKSYLQHFLSAALLGLLATGANAQVTDSHRVWAKDADILHDYYHWGDESKIQVMGSANNFTIPVEDGVTQALNFAWNNCFLKFDNVDFGTSTESLTFLRNVPRGAIIEFWIDRDETTRHDTFYNDNGFTTTGNKDVIELSGGKFLGRFQHWYDKTGDWNRWESHTININKIGGIHDLYVVFRTGGKSEFNQTVGGLYYLDLHRTLGDEATALTSAATNLQIPIGKYSLDYTVTPATASTEDLVWTVEAESTPGVLTVNNGLVLAMKPGTATVKCLSSRAAGDVSLSYNIEVVGSSTADAFKLEAETASDIFNTYLPENGQSFAKMSIDGELGGGAGQQGLAYAWNTNFAVYKDVDFGSFTDLIKFRHAEIRGGAVEFWLDRNIVAETDAKRLSGDLNNPSQKALEGGVFLGRYDFLQGNDFLGNNKWKEFELPIVPASGVHDLYVVFLRGGKATYEKTTGHYDWFELSRHYANIYQIVPSKTSLTMNEDGEETITLTIVPEVVYNEDVTWQVTEGSDIVSVDNTGKITAIKPGSAKVKVMSDANNAVFAEINVTVSQTVGIDEAENEVELSYKNPITDNLQILANTNIENVVVTDLSGRIVYEKYGLSNTEFNLNSSAWNKGLYLVQVKTSDDSKVLRITKQ